MASQGGSEGGTIIHAVPVYLQSFNHKDAFVLKQARKIYVWYGDSFSIVVRHATSRKAEHMETEDAREVLAGRNSEGTKDELGEPVSKSMDLKEFIQRDRLEKRKQVGKQKNASILEVSSFRCGAL